MAEEDEELEEMTLEDWNELAPQVPLDPDSAERIVSLIANGVSREEAVNKYLQIPLEQAYEFYEFWEKVSAEIAGNEQKDG